MSLHRTARVFGCLSFAILAQLAFSNHQADAREASDALMASAGTAITSAGVQCTAIDARAIRPELITTNNTLSTITASTDSTGFNSGAGSTASFQGGSGGGGSNGSSDTCTNTTSTADSSTSGEQTCDSVSTSATSTATLDADGTSPNKSTAVAYEVACSEGLGYVILNQPSLATATHKSSFVSYNCLEMAESGQKYLACALPANQDSSTAMNALIAKSGVNCALSGQRGIGHIGSTSLFEVSCQTGDGFVLATATPVRFDQPVTATPCLDIRDKSALSCTLDANHAIEASLLSYAASSDNHCNVTAHHWYGVGPKGTIFEVACDNGAGYLIRRTNAGLFDAMVNCTDLPGKCTLTKKSS